MADKVDVKTLGHSGVIIDQNPLEPTLPDDALRSAQNAMHDPTQGFGGALRKRRGLAQFNLTNAGGAILGGIPMAVAGTGGAPATGGGSSTGSSTGAGQGTGAPGGTTDGASGGSFAPQGAGAFNGGSKLFGGGNLIVIGRGDNTKDAGVGWYLTSEKIANSANLVTTPGPPGRVYSFPPTTTFPAAWGQPMVWHAASGYLFYAVNGTSTTQNAGARVTIRKTNGATDVLVCTVPVTIDYNPSNHGGDSNGSNGNIRSAVIGMCLGDDGNIYLAVKEKASGQTIAGNWGSVSKLNPTTGAISLINCTSTPTAPGQGYAGIPFSIAYFNKSVYWGEHNLGATSDTQKDTNSQILATSPDQSYSLIDHGFSDSEVVSCLYPFPQTAPASNPNMNVAANRILFCGFGVNKTTPVFPFIYTRNRGAVQIGTSAYTGVLQASGGAAASGAYWNSMVAFNDKLYASFYNPGAAAKVYQLTPNYANVLSDGGWDGSGTWTAVLTATHNVPLYLFVFNNVLYSIGALDLAQIDARWSVDGVTWNDVTANIPSTPNQTYPLPFFAGFAQ